LRLAQALGKSLPELRADLTPGDFARWRAFDAVEPMGERRLDFLFALLRRTVIALVAKQPPDLDKLLPDWWAKPEGADGG
jgi:hypothetical protein